MLMFDECPNSRLSSKTVSEKNVNEGKQKKKKEIKQRKLPVLFGLKL